MCNDFLKEVEIIFNHIHSHINFLRKLNIILTGFVTFWYDYIEYAITTHRRYIRSMLQNEQHGLSLIDLQIAFFILFIGLLMASILFIVEIAVYRYNLHVNG